MKEITYYYPLWNDTMKLTGEEMIEYLIKKEVEKENQSLTNIVEDIKYITERYKKVL